MSKIIKYVCMQEAPVVIDSNFKVDTVPVPVPIPVDTTLVDDFINSAHSEAEAILNQAKIAAEHCLSEAWDQVASIKQQAYDEGYQKGVIQGRQSGRDAMQQMIDQAIAKKQEVLTATEQAAKAMMLAAERQIIDIELSVARKILAYEISENPMVVLPLVKAALQKVSDQEEVVIRVSHDDFDAVLLAKQDLQTMVGGEHALTITVDSTIKSGSCVIDTSYGTVDARVDTQFETIKKALQGVA